VAKKAPNTVNAHLTAVDAFYTHHGLGPANAGRVDLPQQTPRALEEAELRRVLRGDERLPSIRDKTIVRTLYYSGVRAAVLVALDEDDVPTTARTGTVIVPLIRPGEACTDRPGGRVPATCDHMYGSTPPPGNRPTSYGTRRSAKPISCW